MANSVTGARIVQAELAACRGQEVVIIHILETNLKSVMVRVYDRTFCPNPGQAQGFELNHGHLASCVMHKGIIYTNANFTFWHHLASHQMFGNYLLY
jgi:hypothetical protein